MIDSMIESNYPNKRIDGLQTHARSLAIELMAAGIVFDTLVRKEGDECLSDMWEVPSGHLPETYPFVLGEDGLYVSQGPREIGRQVRPIDEREVVPKGLEMMVRYRLQAMEKKHDIFNRLPKASPKRNT